MNRHGAHQGAQKSTSTPFSFPSVTSASDGAGAWILRSPIRFGYSWDTAAALLARVDAEGAITATVGRARVPEHVMLQDLMNAGRVVADRGRLYYVPFIRDEIVALDTMGDTLWVASRDLPQTRGEPRFELQDGRVVIDYHPVNLGASLGPDDRLYVLSTPGFTTERSRLDAFDPQTGRLLRSAELDTALPTIAADASGRVYLLDATRLLTGIAPAARERFPRVALATSAGDSVHSASFVGSVTLVNLWASWCKPCREEMPALDEIRRTVRDTTFAFVSINGDAARESAEEFLREMALDIPFAIAGPGFTRDYHALGLPYTVLLDRDGRVVQRWVGYTGRDQIAAIRAAIQLELERGPSGAHALHFRHR
jgi:thiol-disulfide isomerase/thioredoxin